MRRIVLAYSGGLDTSVIIRWLRERYQAEVIAFCANLGQGDDDDAIREKALKTGASKVIIEDLRDEFVRDYVFAALQANAVYEGAYLLGTALARPLIAKRQVEIAVAEGADAVAHGATGKGNDQVRFELAYTALAPDLRVIAPWREWEFTGRQALIAYAAEHGIPVAATAEKPYSMDRNILHISIEGGPIEDPWVEPEADTYVLTVPPERAPDQPLYLTLDFEQGVPVAVDQRRLDPALLLRLLNEVGGVHAIGRIDLVENRYVGMKVRGIYETPGGTILHAAHRALESITLDREVLRIRDSLVPQYAALVYNGFWFSPERELLQSLIAETQRHVTGTVRLKLYKGTCQVVGRRSPVSLHHPAYATFEEEDVFDQRDSSGFIRVAGLRLKIRALMAREGR